MWVGHCVARAVPVRRSRHRWLSDNGPGGWHPMPDPRATGSPGIVPGPARRAAALAAAQKQYDGE